MWSSDAQSATTIALMEDVQRLRDGSNGSSIVLGGRPVTAEAPSVPLPPSAYENEHGQQDTRPAADTGAVSPDQPHAPSLTLQAQSEELEETTRAASVAIAQNVPDHLLDSPWPLHLQQESQQQNQQSEQPQPRTGPGGGSVWMWAFRLPHEPSLCLFRPEARILSHQQQPQQCKLQGRQGNDPSSAIGSSDNALQRPTARSAAHGRSSRLRSGGRTRCASSSGGTVKQKKAIRPTTPSRQQQLEISHEQGRDNARGQKIHTATRSLTAPPTLWRHSDWRSHSETQSHTRSRSVAYSPYPQHPPRQESAIDGSKGNVIVPRVASVTALATATTAELTASGSPAALSIASSTADVRLSLRDRTHTWPPTVKHATVQNGENTTQVPIIPLLHPSCRPIGPIFVSQTQLQIGCVEGAQHPLPPPPPPPPPIPLHGGARVPASWMQLPAATAATSANAAAAAPPWIEGIADESTPDRSPPSSDSSYRMSHDDEDEDYEEYKSGGRNRRNRNARAPGASGEVGGRAQPSSSRRQTKPPPAARAAGQHARLNAGDIAAATQLQKFSSAAEALASLATGGRDASSLKDPAAQGGAPNPGAMGALVITQNGQQQSRVEWRVEFPRTLNDVALGWGRREKQEYKRRLVTLAPRHLFAQGRLVLDYAITPVGDFDPARITMSCIYWSQVNDFFYTSVDFIGALERVLEAPFSVEEKNRIRRNMETFRPVTITRGRADTSRFFSTIMQFGDPKPRKIEKDTKVFRWSTLEAAILKIVEKWVRSLESDALDDDGGGSDMVPAREASSSTKTNTPPILPSLRTLAHSARRPPLLLAQIRGRGSSDSDKTETNPSSGLSQTPPRLVRIAPAPARAPDGSSFIANSAVQLPTPVLSSGADPCKFSEVTTASISPMHSLRHPLGQALHPENCMVLVPLKRQLSHGSEHHRPPSPKASTSPLSSLSDTAPSVEREQLAAQVIWPAIASQSESNMSLCSAVNGTIIQQELSLSQASFKGPAMQGQSQNRFQLEQDVAQAGLSLSLVVDHETHDCLSYAAPPMQFAESVDDTWQQKLSHDAPPGLARLRSVTYPPCFPPSNSTTAFLDATQNVPESLMFPISSCSKIPDAGMGATQFDPMVLRAGSIQGLPPPTAAQAQPSYHFGPTEPLASLESFSMAGQYMQPLECMPFSQQSSLNVDSPYWAANMHYAKSAGASNGALALAMASSKRSAGLTILDDPNHPVTMEAWVAPSPESQTPLTPSCLMNMGVGVQPAGALSLATADPSSALQPHVAQDQASVFPQSAYVQSQPILRDLSGAMTAPWYAGSASAPMTMMGMAPHMTWLQGFPASSPNTPAPPSIRVGQVPTAMPLPGSALQATLPAGDANRAQNVLDG